VSLSGRSSKIKEKSVFHVFGFPYIENNSMNYFGNMDAITNVNETLFHNSSDSHGGRNNYQISLTFMENQGNPLNDTEQVKVEEHTLVLIKNRFHQ